MTNREAHEKAAGMPLDMSFFLVNHIDPDAEYTNVNHLDRLLKESAGEPSAIDKTGRGGRWT